MRTIVCRGFKRDCLQGDVHLPGHIYRMALYRRIDALDGALTVGYKPDGEASGAGYSAGGVDLAGRKVGVDGQAAWLSWDDAAWPNATIAAAAALIYNDSLPQRNAICVLDFEGPQIGTNTLYAVRLPKQGLVRLS